MSDRTRGERHKERRAIRQPRPSRSCSSTVGSWTVAVTKRVIAAQPSPAVLVSLSYGGVVITEAGNDLAMKIGCTFTL